MGPKAAETAHDNQGRKGVDVTVGDLFSGDAGASVTQPPPPTPSRKGNGVGCTDARAAARQGCADCPEPIAPLAISNFPRRGIAGTKLCLACFLRREGRTRS